MKNIAQKKRITKKEGKTVLYKTHFTANKQYTNEIK